MNQKEATVITQSRGVLHFIYGIHELLHNLKVWWPLVAVQLQRAMKKCRGIVADGYQMPWEIFRIISWNCGKSSSQWAWYWASFPTTGSESILFMLIPTSVFPSFVEGAGLLRPFFVFFSTGITLFLAARTEVKLERFLVFSGKLTLGGRRLSGIVGGLFVRIPPKGLTRGPVVG